MTHGFSTQKKAGRRRRWLAPGGVVAAMAALMTVPVVATAGGATAATVPNLSVNLVAWGTNSDGELATSRLVGH
jgi:hypothetical protein